MPKKSKLLAHGDIYVQLTYFFFYFYRFDKMAVNPKFVRLRSVRWVLFILLLLKMSTSTAAYMLPETLGTGPLSEQYEYDCFPASMKGKPSSRGGLRNKSSTSTEPGAFHFLPWFWCSMYFQSISWCTLFQAVQSVSPSEWWIILSSSLRWNSNWLQHPN